METPAWRKKKKNKRVGSDKRWKKSFMVQLYGIHFITKTMRTTPLYSWK